MSGCTSCRVSCCAHCEHHVNGRCNDYENRPLKCRLFPWVYNPYADRVQVLHTCPMHEEFAKAGCPDEAAVKRITLEALLADS